MTSNFDEPEATGTEATDTEASGPEATDAVEGAHGLEPPGDTRALSKGADPPWVLRCPIDIDIDIEAVGLLGLAGALRLDRPVDAVLDTMLESDGTLPVEDLPWAEAIVVVSEPPPSFRRIASHPFWFESHSDRTLAVVASAGRSVGGCLRALGAFAVLARSIEERLGGRHGAALRAVLGRGGPGASSPADEAELALHLASTQAAVRRVLESRRLCEGLLRLAERPFSPRLSVDRSLSPSAAERVACDLAAALLEEIPGGPIALALSDGRALLDHVSPYVRDLGHSLVCWGLEHPDALEPAELADVLEEFVDDPHPDLAAMVTRGLLRVRPDLAVERREAEAKAGLWLKGVPAGDLGFATLERLEGADPVAVPSGSVGLLALVSSSSSAFRSAALERLLSSRRVTDVLFVVGCARDAWRPVVPRCVVSDLDGASIPSADAVHRHAQSIRLAADILDRLDVGGSDDEGILGALARVRRAAIVGDAPTDLTPHVVAYSTPPSRQIPELALRISEANAARLGLSALLTSRSRTAAFGSRARKSSDPKHTSLHRRFRA